MAILIRGSELMSDLNTREEGDGEILIAWEIDHLIAREPLRVSSDVLAQIGRRRRHLSYEAGR